MKTWCLDTNVKKNGLKVFINNRIHQQDHRWIDTGARSPSGKQQQTNAVPDPDPDADSENDSDADSENDSDADSESDSG